MAITATILEAIQVFIGSSAIVLIPWLSVDPILSVVYPLGTRSLMPEYI